MGGSSTATRETDFRSRKRFPLGDFTALGRSLKTLREARSQGGGLLGLAVFGALLEGAGLLLLVPLLAVLGVEATEQSSGAVYRAFSAAFGSTGTTASLTTVIALFVAILVALGFVRYGERVAGTSLVETKKVELRERVFRALSLSDWTFHRQWRGSDILHTLTDDVARAGASLQATLVILSGVIATAVYLAVALYLSPIVTAMALGAAVLVVRLLRARQRASDAASEEFSAEVQAMYGSTSELLRGMRAAKIHGDENDHIDAFEDSARALSNEWTKTVRGDAETRALFMSGGVIAAALLLWVDTGLLGVGAATLLVIACVFGRLVPRVGEVREALRSLEGLEGAHERIDALLIEAEASAEPGSWRGAPTPPLKVGIRLEHVSTRPSNGREPGSTLLDVTLEVVAYSATAVVGPEEGGSLALTDVLAGIVPPQTGRMLVDGQPLAGAEIRGWRKGIGYVSSDAWFPTGSVRKILGLRDAEPREAELRNALRIAQLEEFIGRLPSGVETVVDMQARPLSPNERRGLALARAILRRPQIILIDELTGTPDAESESFVTYAMRCLRGKMTVLLVTDRPSLAKEADWIHVIDGGVIVESGTWERLSHSGGRLNGLVTAEGLYGGPAHGARA
jgi:ATP-binding cassette subfamily C protein